MRKLLFISYTLFLLTVLCLSYFFVDPNLHYLQWLPLHFTIKSQFEKVLLLVSVLIIFFVFYISILFFYRKKVLSQSDGVIFIATTICCLLFSYPAVYSYDIFNYLATAKVAYLYHENPYLIMPIEFSGEPLLAFMHAPNKVALYGPGWILLTFLSFFLGFGNFLLTLLLFKVLIALFYSLLLYFMYRVSRNFSAVLFLALNPLVIIETIVSGHNDVVMMAFLFIGFFLYLHRSRISGFFLYACSVSIKYATGILFPVFILLTYLHRKKTISEKKLFRWSMFAMILIFFLSSLREEIYPWYAIWFLPFVALVGSRREKMLAVLFTFCLELRYFPYMLFLTHFGITPYVKMLITFAPLFFVLAYFFFRRVWEKAFFRYSQ